MIVATTAAFGLWPGTLHAALGSLASAAVGYWVGHVIGAARIGRHLGPRAEKIKNNIGEHGIIAIMTIRIVPIAPFSIVNVVAGALNINFTHYMLGTALGLAPGFIVLAFAGDQVSSFMAHPSLSGAAVLGLILLAWLALSLVLQSALRRRTKV
jgi:phospholipase D1/2